jgi:broad specificity phosphatase PhoE
MNEMVGRGLGRSGFPDASVPEPVLNRIAFWFLRHGETDWNAQGLSQGNTDVPLNATGVAQARAAAAVLRNRGIASIVASPLLRARVTAEIVGDALRLPVITDKDLREAAFGVQEGQAMGNWYPDWIVGAFTPAGGEEFAKLRRRAVSALNRATAMPAPVLVVSHGALFRAVRGAMGLEINIRTRNAVPVFCRPPIPGGSEWSLTDVPGADAAAHAPARKTARTAAP